MRQKKNVHPGQKPYCSKRCNALANLPRHKAGIRHGTATGYNYFKCRCKLCREANRVRQEKYRRFKNPGGLPPLNYSGSQQGGRYVEAFLETNASVGEAVAEDGAALTE